MRLKIGVIVDGRASALQITQWGRLAERYGLSHFWVAGSLDAKDPFLRLGALARATSRLTLGAMAFSPFEIHPVRMGMSLLTLNELADGRAAIVVGAGGDLSKAMALQPAGRVRASRECVEILRRIAAGKLVRYVGRYFRVKGFAAPWAHQRRPAIYVGANRPQMLEMAAQVADGIMFSDMPPAYVRRLVAEVRRAARKARRPAHAPVLSNFFAWNVQSTDEEARRLAARYMPLRLYYVRDVASTIGVSPAAARRLATQQWAMVQALLRHGRTPDLPPRLVHILTEHLTITSDAHHLEPCIERLQEFERTGLTEIALNLYGDPRAGLRILGEQVLPTL